VLLVFPGRLKGTITCICSVCDQQKEEKDLMYICSNHFLPKKGRSPNDCSRIVLPCAPDDFAVAHALARRELT
jgi:hypothetical protein